MTFAKITSAALGAALAAVMMVPAAHASIANQMSKLTFNRAVQLPGHEILPAGTYWFKIVNTKALPNSVMIYNKSRTQVEATELTEPAYRAKSQGKTEVTLAGTNNSNRPPMLVKWFYPGTDYGHQFLYSQRTERRIEEEGTRNILAQPYSG
jgi:hypothetical protein